MMALSMVFVLEGENRQPLRKPSSRLGLSVSEVFVELLKVRGVSSLFEIRPRIGNRAVPVLGEYVCMLVEF